MKYIFLTALFLINILGFSQSWVDYSPNKKGEFNFYEIQNNFNNYWSSKDIKSGYYTENGNKVKAKGWKQFKRWENFHSIRIDKQTGDFPSKKQINTAKSQYFSNQTRSLSGSWSNLGPENSNGGYAGVGRINQVAFHPTNNNILWATTPNGGLWTTTNGGSSWSALTDANEVLTSTAIAVPSDYASTNTLYLGTGEMMTTGGGIGVLKSTNGGNTWNATGLVFNVAEGYSVNNIIIHPTNTDIIYAATTNGVYKSINAGANWSHILTDQYISDLQFKPNDPSVFYASHKHWGRIYKFTNNGDNHSTVYDDYSNGSRRVTLGVTPANPNIVYAIVVDADGGLKNILKSINSGDAFSAVHTPANPPTSSEPNMLCYAPDGDEVGGISWYSLCFAVNPNDENTLFCGGVNLWKSTDGGVTWNINTYWYSGVGYQAVHADQHFLAYNENTIYACNDGGMYKSTNQADWTNISNGIINSQMYKLGVSQTNSNSVITGLQDNGSKLLNSSNNWADVRGGDGMECIIDYTNYNTQYATYQNGEIGRTTNAWANTTEITPSAAEDGAWVTPYTLDPNNNSTIFAGYHNVWKSINKGDNWTKISTMSSDYLRSISVAKSNSQYIYTATYNNIWRTTSGGSSWADITNNLPASSSDITSIEIKNNDVNTVWVTLGAFNSNVVFETTNGGTSWTNISASTIIQNIQNTAETELYIGTDYGVYIKLGTNNWQLFNTGLPKLVVTELEIYYDSNVDNSKLKAATYGRGLWESDLYTVTVSSPPSITTNAATNIQETSATINGDITDNGGAIITESGFVYSAIINPLIGGASVTQIQTLPITTSGLFIENLTSLSGNTTYYYKAYAINNVGTTYGTELSFITLPILIPNCALETLPFIEDFEGFTNTNYIAQNSNIWNTWSSTPGSAEDAICSNNFANSGTKSMYISGTNDMILPMCDATSGAFQIEMQMYMETGHGAYFNFQHILTTEWAFDVLFGDQGRLHVGDTDYSFSYNHDTWVPITIIIDLDNNNAELKVNNINVHSWNFNLTNGSDIGANQLSAINFYATSDDDLTPSFYVDDINITNYISINVENKIVDNGMKISPNPSNGIFNISFAKDFDKADIIIYNSIGDIVLTKMISDKENLINISNKSNGTYFIKIIQDNSVTVLPIVKN